MSDIQEDDALVSPRDQATAVGGVATVEDRHFTYSVLAAMSVANLTVVEALGRVTRALDSADETGGVERRRRVVASLAAAFERARSADFINAVLEEGGLILTSEEACVLAVTLSEATPAVAAVLFGAAAKFVEPAKRR